MSYEVFKSLVTLDILAGVISTLSLTSISLERMIAVKFSARHINMTNKPALITIATVWLCSLTLSQAKHLVTTTTGVRTYTGVVFTCCYVVPLVVIVGAYAVIFHTARNMITTNSISLKVSREIRLAKNISLVIGLFFICWTPFFLTNIIYVYCDVICFEPGAPRPSWPIYVSKVLHYSNSMMNFFVYGFRSPDFRQYFRKYLCCLNKRIRSASNVQRDSRGETIVSEIGSDEYTNGGHGGMTSPLNLDTSL